MGCKWKNVEYVYGIRGNFIVDKSNLKNSIKDWKKKLEYKINR